MKVGDLVHAACAAAFWCASCSRPSDARESAATAAPAAQAARLEPAAQVPRGDAGSEARAKSPRPQRDMSPRIVELRRWLSLGRVDEARASMNAGVGASTGNGAERSLFEARLASLSGATLDALRWIETARQQDPDDPEVYATAAEIYAAKESLDAAWSEIRRGLERCGETAELVRAKGVVWLCREGGAAKGLEFLEQARARDPSVAYLERPSSQAHLLVGKAAARDGDLVRALAHARQAAALDPYDVDAARFLSEALAASGDFDASIEVLDALVRAGEPLEGELGSRHKQAAIAALLARRREEALQHFVLARRHGLDAEGLGSGARLLTEAALEEVRAGVAAYERGERDLAERSFRRALELDPGEIQAENHLAVVTFQQGSFAEARDLWRSVLEEAEREGLSLPDPVHINLAKAEVKLGDLGGARATLERYLAREPHGEWVDLTRAMLAGLDSTPEPR